MKKLSTGQLRVLESVARGHKITSNVTRGDTVSGTAATALEKRGLVIRKKTRDQTYRVTITSAGRKALALPRPKGRKKVSAKRR